MQEYVVTIDSEKCVGCGLCVSDCVGMDIELKDGKAHPSGKRCIGCGHCEAICPKGAVSITGFEDEIEEIEEQVRLDPEQLMMAIKTRRTIRQFTDQKIPKSVLKMIIEAGRMAPTGANRQGISYIILDRKINEFESMAVSTFQKLLGIGKKAIPALANMNIDDHFFFKKAPIAILIVGNDKVSASLAAENMAFMAEANGLGVLYSGFFTMCANRGKIHKALHLEKKQKVVTTLVLGYPAVKYHRTVHRKKAQVKVY